MKLAATGKLIWIGSNHPSESPRAAILLREGDEDDEPMILEVDLSEKEAMEFARNLYGEVRICLETVLRPKIEVVD